LTSTFSIPRQRALPFSVSQRTVLVDVNGVRAARGVDADTVFASVEDALRDDHLRFVFDVATGAPISDPARIRELRFWAREIIAPETCRGIGLEEALLFIVPAGRVWFQSGELCQLLLISRATLKCLGAELRGEIVDGSLRVRRTDLIKFFHRRWVAAAEPRPGIIPNSELSTLRSKATAEDGRTPNLKS
jgi:hypothetical protein